MLSRVADALYWIGRYLERAEHTARLVDVNTYLSLDSTPESSGRHWHRVFDSLQATMADGGTERRRRPGRISSRSIAATRNRSPRASTPRARTCARCASRSAPTCGSGSTGSIWTVRRTAEDATLAGPAALVPARRDRGLPPVHRAHRRDDEPRRGLALPRARPLPRARRHLLGAARHARPRLPGSAARRGRARSRRRMDGAAALVHGARGLHAALHRPHATRGGSPTSCCSTPSSRARSASPSSRSRRRCAASRGSPAARTPAGRSGSPAACARRSTTRRSTRSWTTACRRS